MLSVYATYLFAAGAVVLIYYFLTRFKYRKPAFEFVDLLYDKTQNKIELIVRNCDSKGYFVKPSLRLVKFIQPEEWKEQTANGNGLTMSQGSSSSLIKGYDLLGEEPEAILLEDNTTKKFVYDVPSHIPLDEYDNIRIDLHYGNHSDVVRGMVGNTMHLRFKEIEFPKHEVDVPKTEVETELLPPVQKFMFPEQGVEPNIPPVSEAVQQKTIPDERIRKSGFPLQATCICCGRDAWLKWIVDGSHVCTECKDFLKDKYGLTEPPEPEQTKIEEEILKPRQIEILKILKNGGGYTIDDLSSAFNISKATVAVDVKFLLSNEYITRTRKGRFFVYSLSNKPKYISA